MNTTRNLSLEGNSIWTYRSGMSGPLNWRVRISVRKEASISSPVTDKMVGDMEAVRRLQGSGGHSKETVPDESDPEVSRLYHNMASHTRNHARPPFTRIP